ncbi:DNA binding, excisionase family domain protein [Chlamydia ibidis]|uniref:DNA binding, excisionase family domain protein n=2 Tax=Chlamydia ibidis TaxID=1405396 RepID=S7J4U7_9CHLA|nr:helix-turn-helix domain-containing protein [Chlamydia ibidis]EPP35439.1 DNA binding, excisionase family domain protein [Chlamydia ibidis]EQM63215.1 DNA binding, excisionase family domain protein [Chlamydia ibidis 10-1398/6]
MECVQQESCFDLEEKDPVTSAEEGSTWVSITQAAKLHNVTRQAIYVAIKQKKLKASKTTRWEINLKDLEEYKKNRYSRSKSLYEGELLFDNEKGCYSVNQVAQMLGIPVQKVYYATRTGTMRGDRKGAAWVIHCSEIERYRNEYLSKQVARKAREGSNDIVDSSTSSTGPNFLDQSALEIE